MDGFCSLDRRINVTNKEKITLNQLIRKLQNIKKKIGHGNVKVFFDTEGSNFNCHIVPIHNVNYLEKNVVDEQDYVILTTKFHY